MKSDSQLLALYGAAIVVGVTAIGMAMHGFGNVDSFDREAVCRQATQHFYRDQSAPFPAWVGVEYGEAPGPRVNGVVHCDDPTRPVIVRVY